jgi:hypothetical protein
MLEDRCVNFAISHRRATGFQHLGIQVESGPNWPTSTHDCSAEAPILEDGATNLLLRHE